MYKIYELSLCVLLAIARSSTATAAIDPIDHVPTDLADPDEPTDYPDPICSKCTIIVISEDDAESFLELFGIAHVPSDPELEGDLAVTVELDDEDPHVFRIVDVKPLG
jgi:hypothetical protein